ncbi:TRAP transporter small permease [Chloroflexota bacterium]
MMLKTVFNRILDIFSVVAGVLVALMMLEVCADVVMRYFLNRPIPWTIEFNQYAMTFVLFLGAAWVLRDEGHVVMDIVINRLGSRSRKLTNGITSIIAAIVCGIVTGYGIDKNIDYVQTGYIFGDVLNIPAFSLQFIVPLGMFLLTIQFLRRAYGYLGKP